VNVLGFDPSIANMGWGVVATPADGVWRPACIVGADTVHTKPSWPIAERIHVLWTVAHDVTARVRPDIVVIEEPAIAGLYARHRGRQRSKGSGLNADALRLLAMATGAIMAGARVAVEEGRWPCRVLERKPSRDEKRARHRILDGMTTGLRLSEHARDALVLALLTATDTRLREAA
jgi:hypothetical protein